MIWTNVYKLPLPLMEAIVEDLYYGKREEGLKKYCETNNLDRSLIVHFSVGELIKSPRQVLLGRRHAHEIIKDVAMEVFRVLGTAVHALLWQSAKRINERGGDQNKAYIAEERLFYHFKVGGRTVVVSGEPDLVTPEGVIEDYKVTAVWSWLKGIKDDWEKQLNMYAMFRTLGGKVTTGLSICYILRDWSVSEAMQAGYPQAGAQKEEVKLWSFEEQKDFLMKRIEEHLNCLDFDDDLLPECSDIEMWAKEDAYAVKRQGNKVASKVFSSKFHLEEGRKADPEFSTEDANAMTIKDAQAYADEMTAKLKGKEKEREYFLEHRPGERTKCLRFCDARGFCSQFKEYSAAAFRTPTEKAEEVA